MNWTQAEIADATSIGVDVDRLEEIDARLNLRRPNRDALDVLALKAADHFATAQKPAPFECVLDSATGVGKTYIIASAIDYFAGADAIRNFAIITPGRTILEKTIANFTAGHAKSLLPNMAVQPVVVTSENFASAATRAAMDDDRLTKLYIFTVQSLTSPTTKQGRKTHTYHEGLGEGFYEHLAGLDDLIVFADEHHCYSGPAFSKAVYGLEPRVIVGLTATPLLSTPPEQIIFRYPLAAAIAEKWVKTPVIVARKDDRVDDRTKLSDAVGLLRAKQRYLDAYIAERGLDAVHPILMVVAQNTDEADEYEAILSSPTFDDGQWADTILTVHSNLSGDAKEDALAKLAAVDSPDSPVRIIISVGMLKEGWDVRNVYVIASMRASVSDVLTEQTLGRGLRLPFGAHTGIEILDTVEVLAHEKYQKLLERANVLNEKFIDRHTRAVVRRNSDGDVIISREEQAVSAEVIGVEGTLTLNAPKAAQDAVTPASTGIAVTTLEERTETAESAAPPQMSTMLVALDQFPPIKVPHLTQVAQPATFRLADITNLEPFRTLGRSIAVDPDTELRRTVVDARVEIGPDGLPSVQMLTREAADQLEASPQLYPLEEVRGRLKQAVITSEVVDQRRGTAAQAEPLIDAFVDGLGPNAEKLLSAYEARATGRLVQLVIAEHKQYARSPRYDEVVEVTPLNNARRMTRHVTEDRTGKFERAAAYTGWKHCLYGTDWFDSSTERDFANIIDATNDVAVWVRLHVGDLQILWTSEGRTYNADFIVVNGDRHWVVEIKADRDAPTEEVQEKREAARRWVNYVNASDQVTDSWGYLLLTEQDIKDSQGSWRALKGLGT